MNRGAVLTGARRPITIVMIVLSMTLAVLVSFGWSQPAAIVLPIPLLIVGWIAAFWAAGSWKTALNRQAEQLTAERANLQAMFDANQVGMLLFDERAQVVLANGSVAELFGRQPSDLVGSRPGDALCCLLAAANKECPGIAAACRGCNTLGTVKQVLKDGQPIRNNESTMRCFVGGQERQLQFALSASPVELDRRKHVLLTLLDITHRRRTESDLKDQAAALGSANKARTFLADIVESSDDAIMVESLEGKVTFWNEAATLLFGYTDEEVVGQPASTLAPEDLLVEEREELETAKRGIRTEHLSTVRKRKDGSRVAVSLNISPVRDVSGQVVAVSTISRDITDQKKAEKDLKEYADALEAANRTLEKLSKAAESASRSKSEFLANMSHEIRTPMTAILGFTDVLLGEDGLENAPPQRAAAFHTIKRNGMYLLNLLDDILDLSKIEAGKLDVECTICSPCDVVGEVATLMSVPAQAKGLPLKIEYAGGIPERIQCDPTRLRQILINLVGNAIKFTETGSIRLVARLAEGSDSESRMQFDVIDTGVGLTEEQVVKLFQPFTQADASTTRKSGGTGLGLTISKRLAEMLGGDITISSSEDGGSTFSVTVDTGPLEHVSILENITEVVARNNLSTETPAAPTVNLNCRILLAEDGPDNQQLISFILEKVGANVTLAENGLIAYEVALAASQAGEPFDVILMDMQMPVMDGYTATRRLRDADYAGSIVALTANAMAGDDKKCREAGCDGYATKPIDRARLYATVARYAGLQPHPMGVVACDDVSGVAANGG